MPVNATQELVPHESDSSSIASTRALSKRERLKNFGLSAKATTKSIISKSNSSPTHKPKFLDEAEDGIYLDSLTENAAFNTSKVFNNGDHDDRSPLRQSMHKVHEAARAAAHPRETLKRKAAGRVTLHENPFVTAEADAELLAAHDELQEAKISASGTSDDDHRETEKQDRYNALEKDRDSMRAAWVTGKHVKRARVMRVDQIPYPRRNDYWSHSALQRSRFEWERYVAHVRMIFLDLVLRLLLTDHH